MPVTGFVSERYEMETCWQNHGTGESICFTNQIKRSTGGLLGALFNAEGDKASTGVDGVQGH